MICPVNGLCLNYVTGFLNTKVNKQVIILFWELTQQNILLFRITIIAA
jgi:hypothetical protein